ncbi:MAG: HAD family phosphatase [Erysipelotrichaceae bacterium]|nr:HAD family phosphatase [Erysipelotrichaceae bacterium]
MIKNIIFDLGQVLIGFNPLNSLLNMGYPQKEAELLNEIIFNDQLWQDGDAGVYKSEEEAINLYINKHPQHHELIKDFFSKEWKKEVFIPINLDLFQKAKDNGYKIYLLTNFSSYGFDFVYNEFPFIREADGRVVSGKIEMIKPHDDIYLYLLDKFNLKAEECLFFDDNYDNIEAAKRLGINAYRFLGNKQEVLDILDK